MSLEVTLGVVALCLLIQGFHSGSEIAVYSADRIRLRGLAEKGSARARMALRFTENPELLLGTTLVGTNLSVVTAAVVVTLAAIRAYGRAGELFTVLVMSPTSLILGEVIPKSLFQRHADRIILWIAVPLYVSSRVLYPVGWITTRAVRLLFAAIGLSPEEGEPLITRDDLRLIVRDRAPGSDILADEQRMVRRILSFREMRVAEAMRPLVEVHAFRETTPVREALVRAAEDAYSRYPVFHERITKIVGLVTMLDLVYCQDPARPVGEIKRPVMYFPETARLEEAFHRMQQSGAHLAVAVDEYGGAVGILTMEDIFEEIVGEIEDEGDEEEDAFRKVSEGYFLVRGRTEVEQVNERLGIAIPPGEYKTLAGFLMSHLGHIPPPGTRVVHESATFIVTRASDRAIEEVSVLVEKGRTK